MRPRGATVLGDAVVDAVWASKPFGAMTQQSMAARRRADEENRVTNPGIGAHLSPSKKMTIRNNAPPRPTGWEEGWEPSHSRADRLCRSRACNACLDRESYIKTIYISTHFDSW